MELFNIAPLARGTHLFDHTFGDLPALSFPHLPAQTLFALLWCGVFVSFVALRTALLASAGSPFARELPPETLRSALASARARFLPATSGGGGAPSAWRSARLTAGMFLLSAALACAAVVRGAVRFLPEPAGAGWLALAGSLVSLLFLHDTLFFWSRRLTKDLRVHAALAPLLVFVIPLSAWTCVTALVVTLLFRQASLTVCLWERLTMAFANGATRDGAEGGGFGERQSAAALRRRAAEKREAAAARAAVKAQRQRARERERLAADSAEPKGPCLVIPLARGFALREERRLAAAFAARKAALDRTTMGPLRGALLTPGGTPPPAGKTPTAGRGPAGGSSLFGRTSGKREGTVGAGGALGPHGSAGSSRPGGASSRMSTLSPTSGSSTCGSRGSEIGAGREPTPLSFPSFSHLLAGVGPERRHDAGGRDDGGGGGRSGGASRSVRTRAPSSSTSSVSRSGAIVLPLRPRTMHPH